MKTNKTPHGVAMFVVLGGIILFSLLGFVGLKLSEKDAQNSGNLVDIKSQRLTAISGMNQAIARMERDPENTVLQLRAFLDDRSKSWLDFNDATKPIATSTSVGWYELGSDKSACKVEIIGIGARTSDGMTISFRSFGRGRSGDVFEIKAIYHMRGIDYRSVWPTKGPTDAILARGGLTDINAGVYTDAGIYSGNPNVETKIQGNGVSGFKKIRAAGNVNIRQSAGVAGDITIEDNSFIGGWLKVESGLSSVVFNKNLIVNGGLGPIDGSFEVKENFYLRGTNIPNPINQSITVGKMFWVKDAYFTMEGPLNVGSSANDGVALFDAGVQIKGNTTTINGSMHVGPVSDYTTMSQWMGLNSATITITRDLNFWKSDLTTNAGSVIFQRATATVGGNVYLAEELHQRESGSLTIEGTSVLRKGIADINFVGTNPSLVFKGKTWMQRFKQRKFKGVPEFHNELSLNGAISRCFAGPGAYAPSTGTCGGDQNLWKTWRFNSEAINKNWSYTTDAALIATPDATTIANGNSPTVRNSDETYESLPSSFKIERPTPPTIQSLGYTEADTKLSLDDNPASEVNASNFPDAFYANADWDAIYSDYKNSCKLDGWNVDQQHARAPSAAQLYCIYKAEQLKGDQESGGRLWNKEWLVIHIDDLLKFKDIEKISTNFTDADRVLPSPVKIFWIIDPSMTVDGHWYSGDLGSMQVVDARGTLTDFGWNGSFYGFIQFENGVSSIKTGGPSTLFGAIEVKKGTENLLQNASNGALRILRNDLATQDAFSSISGNFFASAGLRNYEGSTFSIKAKGPILKFNGDKDATDLTLSTDLTLEDGWVQFERLGEFR